MMGAKTVWTARFCGNASRLAAAVLALFALSAFLAAKAAPPAAIVSRAKNTQQKLSDFDREQQMSFSQRMKRWDLFIAEASRRFGVPQIWIRAVMQIESVTDERCSPKPSR